MSDERWRTLREIEALTGDGQASISARLRSYASNEYLRQHYVKERRRRGEAKQGIWEYRVLKRRNPTHPRKDRPGRGKLTTILSIMNFDCEYFIRQSQEKIAQFRNRATWLKLAGTIAYCLVVVIMATALLQAGLRELYLLGAQRKAEIAWSFFGSHLSLLWVSVLSLPMPKTLPRGNDDLLPWGIALAFYLGIILFSAFLKSRGVTLRKIADKAEETLNLQAPLLMQMSEYARQAGQSVSFGSVSGNGNTFSPTNKITHVLHEGEKQSLMWKILIPIGGAVAAALVNQFFFQK